MPYTNLRSEMEKRGVTISDISRGLKMRRATVSDKIHGKYRFYYDEVQKIKNEFFPDCEIEYLFSTDIEKEGAQSGFSNHPSRY
ncbi:helix-turn-helix domain-containing protein [Paenibacillus zanthoxyli]|uniref:helix-turn-helix domain-containing protein n=1 Tax=Paenibacillus zanthoxyli TaxID=369399 RepID=UPI0004B5213B|nr:helix-turn-helix transcriptional regulator [Paenibacillus zanthoxyli]